MTRALTLALWFGSLSPGLAEAAGPPLYVWTSQQCGPCRLFWRDYQADADGLRTALDGAYTVHPVHCEREPDGPTKRAITGLPAFFSGRAVRVEGYQTPTDLLARLGLRLHEGTTREPSGQSDALAGRVEALAADVDTLRRQVEGVIDWIDRVNPWVGQVDERHKAAVAESRTLAERIEGARQTATEAVETVRAVAGAVAELRGRIAGDGQGEGGRVVEAKPARPTPQAPAKPAPDAVGTVIDLTRIPATLIFGPLGGFAVGAAGWLWERRRRRKAGEAAAGESGGSRPPEPTPPQAPRVETRAVEVESARCKQCQIDLDDARRALDRTRQDLAAAKQLAEANRGEVLSLKRQLAEARLTEGETDYVHVEDDSWQAAYKWARQQWLHREPGREPSARLLDSLITQYLSGLGRS